MIDVTLFFNEGSADKVYRAWIEAMPAGSFSIKFAYGRRGGAMKCDVKSVCSTLELAEQLHRKLIAEKVAKGYRIGESSTPIIAPVKATPGDPQGAGLVIAPMLLNEISPKEAETLLDNRNWCCQPKFDGVRLQLQRIAGEVRGFSRTNKPIALPQPVVEAMLAITTKGDIVVDGELIGDVAYLFDLLRWGKNDHSVASCHERLILLDALLQHNLSAALQGVCTAFTTAEKRTVIKTLKAHGAEGIVFKRVDAPYSPGRPNSGGVALKFKFVATAEVIVEGPNGAKRSVIMRMFDGTIVGKVSVPVNHPLPAVGAVISVRYLYAFRDGSLVQAVYLGERNDIEPSECRLDRLQFKGEKRNA